MKFSINRQVFIKHLSDVQRAISSKTAIPILTGIKLTLTNDSLFLLGSDANISIEKKIDVTDEKNELTIEQTGALVLPSRFFGEIIKKLSSKTFTLTVVDHNKVEITSGQSIFVINGVDAQLYPAIEHIEKTEQNTIQLDAFLLKNVLSQTIIAVAQNELKPIFTGIHIIIEKNTLTAIATDTHRMSKRVITLQTNNDDFTFSCTIPAKSLNELTKIVADDDTLTVTFTDNKVLFVSENLYFYSRLLEGNYPDVSRLLKQEMKSHLYLNASAFLQAVDRVSLLSTENKIDYITLNISEANGLLYSENSEIGYVEEAIEFSNYTGESIKISFNPNYMKDALRVLSQQNIVISLLDNGRPFTLKEENDTQNSFIQLITPVRTRE